MKEYNESLNEDSNCRMVINVLSDENFNFKELLNKANISLYRNWKINLNLTPKTYSNFNESCGILKNYLLNKKDELYENEFKECLIVRILTEKIDELFKIFKSIKNKDYMPFTLFLIEKNADKFRETIKSLLFKYPKIDPRIIYLEEVNNIDNILNILHRFYSIYNDLGDIFEIAYKQKINLIKNYFDFTLNMVLLGRFKQGKTTTLNYICDEIKARENGGGVSQTTKINHYQVDKAPIKVYDIPGFEDKKSCELVVDYLKELNKEINRFKDRIHIYLYVINSKNVLIFNDYELLVFNEIAKNEEALVIYILTHSTKEKYFDEDDEKKDYIKKLNININQILNKNQYRELIKIDEEIKKKISTKMEANEENCIFINYYDQGKNNKKCGTDDLFKVIKNQFELTESYKNKKKISELKANNFDEYMEKIIDESKEIRERAEIKLSSLITFTFTSILPFLQYGITKKDFSKISDTFGINFEQVSKELKTKRIDEEVLKKAKIDKLDFYDPEKSKTSIFENLFKFKYSNNLRFYSSCSPLQFNSYCCIFNFRD